MGTLSNLMNYNNIARRMLAECKGSLDPCGKLVWWQQQTCMQNGLSRHLQQLI